MISEKCCFIINLGQNWCFSWQAHLGHCWESPLNLQLLHLWPRMFNGSFSKTFYVMIVVFLAHALQILQLSRKILLITYFFWKISILFSFRTNFFFTDITFTLLPTGESSPATWIWNWRSFLLDVDPQGTFSHPGVALDFYLLRFEMLSSLIFTSGSVMRTIGKSWLQT